LRSLNYHGFDEMFLKREWIVAVALLSAGCTSTTDLSPTHTSLHGSVVLFDELGQVMPSAEGVVVGVLSSSSVYRVQDTTNSAGEFSLEVTEIEGAGLIFEKEGFGQQFRYAVTEDSSLDGVELFQLSSAEVTSVEAQAEDCGDAACFSLELEVDHFFLDGAGRRVFRVFLSSSPDVGPLSYQESQLIFVPNDHPGLEQSGSDAVFQIDGITGFLTQFSSGNTVHVAVVGATENLSTGYQFDWYDVEFYTDLSPVISKDSFVMQ